MAAKTSRGCSPVLAVRLHVETLQAIKDAALLTGSTPSAVARDCLQATFGQIRHDVALALRLRERMVALLSDHGEVEA